MSASKLAALLVLTSVSNYTNPSADVYDNPCVRHHMRLMLPEAAFAGDPALASDFDAAWDKSAIAQGDIDAPALQSWAETLLTRAGLSTRRLRIEAMQQGGCRNAGIFAVHTDDGSYVAKRSTRMYEPVRWVTLQMHLHCYPRDRDVRDRHPGARWLPGDDVRQARIMPLVAWDYSAAPPDLHTQPPLWPNMLFEHAHGAPLEVPDPERMDSYSEAERESFVQRAYALGVSLALLQVPSLQGSSRAHVFARTAWMHDDLHLSNMFFDTASERIELVDCIEMRRSSGWDKDLRGLVLHRATYPIDHPLRQAWSRALAEGYLSRTTGMLQAELRNAFSGTLIYTKPDLNASDSRARIW